METTPFTTVLEVAVQTRVELDEALDRAVEALRPAAGMKKAGIAITRMQPGRYTVAISDRIPYGTTTQHWAPSPEQL